MCSVCVFYFFFFKQKTAYEMRISDWSSDVCSSDLKEGVITWRSGISCGGSSRGYCRRSDPQIWRSKMRICALQKRKETRRARQLNIQEQNIPSVQMISPTIRHPANASATKERLSVGTAPLSQRHGHTATAIFIPKY